MCPRLDETHLDERGDWRMCGLCMSNALGGWQAFEAASEPDVLSMSTEIVQYVADSGLVDLAEAFPAAASVADMMSGLNGKQPGADNWTDLIEGLFGSTGTTTGFDHDFSPEASGTGLGQALDQLRELLGNQPDLQPLYAGTVEGGTASGSPVGFNQAVVDQLDSGAYWYNSSGQVAATMSMLPPWPMVS